MEIELPTDCGNSPRINVVGQFAVSWAAGDSATVSEWLTEDVSWTLVGGDVKRGIHAAEHFGPLFSPRRMKVLSIVTHGRLASCDGHLEAGSKRMNFSHVFRFASTSKAAKIAELRSYLVQTQY